MCCVLSCSVVSDSLWPRDCNSPGCSVQGFSPGKNTEGGCHALLQRIFPTQGLNPSLPHCRWIFYWLSHQGSRLLWVPWYLPPGPEIPSSLERGYGPELHFSISMSLTLAKGSAGEPWGHCVRNMKGQEEGREEQSLMTDHAQIT